MIALGCACVFLILRLARLDPTAALVTDTIAKDYLKHYGYMGPDNPDPRMASFSNREVQKMALEDFQRMAGISVTGILDEDTKRMMAMPRCGNKDRQAMGDDAKRKKRYTLQGSMWSINIIRYKIKNFTPDMSPTAATTEIERAFKVWSDVTPLNFVRVFNDPDLEIEFTAGEHGDGIPFDGEGGTLAHAYFPQFGGDTHFDDAEQYTFNTSSGVNMFQVAAHEFGHSLGLSHSRVDQALMAPFYRGYVPDFKLHSDDIAGIQALYGRKVARTMPPTPQPNTRPTTPVPPTPSPGATGPTAPSSSTTINYPEMCSISTIDAVIYLENDGWTYMFIGDVYYRIDEYGVDPDSPRPISADWAGLEGNIDAALQSNDPYEEAVIYVFKGTQYWKYTGDFLDYGYPKTIAVDGFFYLPSNIDAAFVWSGNGRAYFIKGDKYYRLSNDFGTPYENRAIDSNYPRSLSLWKGLPSQVSAAFQWMNGRTYFFNMTDYSRFNDRSFSVDNGYPRSTTEWWFGCTSSSGNRQSTVLPPIIDEKDDGGMTVMDRDKTNSGKTNTTVNDNGKTNPGVTGAAVSHFKDMKLFIHMTCLVMLIM